MVHSTNVAAWVIAALTALTALPAAAQIDVSDPWVRGIVAGQTSTGAYMQIKSATDTTLVGVETPVAGIAEIHSMQMEGGMMRMRVVERVPLPAGKSVELRARGRHVMLMDVKQPLKEGDTVPITLTFEDKAGKKSTLVVKAQVRNVAAPAPTPSR